MYIELIRPSFLPPRSLDRYLANGWYRMGQAVFTCRFVIFDSQLYSVIWTRLHLKNHTFRKSHRKLMRRNAKRFDVYLDTASITPEKETLYQKYKANFPGKLADSLSHILHDDGEDQDLFETFEFSIFSEGRLIALSYFDVGDAGIQSILGIYDPDFSRDSLGFYTMLLEVEFGINNGYSFFYPGYVVPNYPAFDYKLRVGPMERFDLPSQRWLAFEEDAERELPNEEILRTLNDLKAQLQSIRIPSRVILYPLYRSASLHERLSDCLKYPLLLECYPDQNGEYRFIITYDYEGEFFQLLHCFRVANLSDHLDPPSFIEGSLPTCPFLLQRATVLAECTTPEEIARVFSNMRR